MADTDKTYEILNYYGLKTNIEDAKKWIKQYVADALTGITTDLMTNVTYNELVSLRDNNKLKPGMLYRMTDYVTKVYSEDESVSSAEHPFDLILFANTTNSLNENALVALHDGDEYFSNSKLNAWEIKYSIDNDTSRFKWAPSAKFTSVIQIDDSGDTYWLRRYSEGDKSWGYCWKYINNSENKSFSDITNWDDFGDSVDYTSSETPSIGSITVNGELTIIDVNYSVPLTEAGKGVIYYLKDEFGNEAPYDFKNIQQRDGEYTFGNNGEDYSLLGYNNGIYNNKILPCVNSETGKQTINKIRVTGKDCHTNLFKPTCVNSYINFPISECDISMNNDGELVVFKTVDFVSGIENKPIEHNYKNDYLTFEALENETILDFYYSEGSDWDEESLAQTIQYSINNKETWNDITFGQGEQITINSGDKVYFKGINFRSHYQGGDGDAYNRIFFDKPCYVYGNLMSLIYADDFINKTTFPSISYIGFGGLFSYNTNLLSKQGFSLHLPATELAYSCYSGMFEGCSSLTTAPELSATTLADSCYRAMFEYCTSLTTAPDLPATTLADSCYNYMFHNCTSLTTAPVLPATTLAYGCYASMFQGCTSLTTAPELPATILTNYCYINMFWNCTSLTTAPELPATTLEGRCYRNMFNGCSSLNYIKCLAINGINQNYSTSSWVSGVQTNSGTFVKHPNVTESTWGRSNNGIPTNWTVEDAVIE